MAKEGKQNSKEGKQFPPCWKIKENVCICIFTAANREKSRPWLMRHQRDALLFSTPTFSSCCFLLSYLCLWKRKTIRILLVGNRLGRDRKRKLKSQPNLPHRLLLLSPSSLCLYTPTNMTSRSVSRCVPPSDLFPLSPSISNLKSSLNLTSFNHISFKIWGYRYYRVIKWF